MKSLEDLENAFARGLNAWESEIVLKQADKMGQKIVRAVKGKTPVDTGNLRRRWSAKAAKKGKGDVEITISNDAEYAAAVNNGHRVVVHGKTVGQVPGQHMLERGIAEYKAGSLKGDLDAMIAQLNGRMR